MDAYGKVRLTRHEDDSGKWTQPRAAFSTPAKGHQVSAGVAPLGDDVINRTLVGLPHRGTSDRFRTGTGL